jgi:hypothetical protein
VDWIHLAQDRGQRRVLLNTVMNQYKVGNISDQNLVCISHFPKNATCPDHLILFYMIIVIMSGEKYNYKIPHWNFLQYPVTSSLLGPNILLSTLFSNTLKLCSSLNVRDQVSHPYKTADKIIVLYILIFTFIHVRREDRRFWTVWKEAFPELNLLLIPLLMQLWFVSVVPKYFNFATFSKDLLATFIHTTCNLIKTLLQEIRHHSRPRS